MKRVNAKNSGQNHYLFKSYLEIFIGPNFLSAANSCLLKLSKDSYAILLGYILLWGFLPAALSEAIGLK